MNSLEFHDVLVRNMTEEIQRDFTNYLIGSLSVLVPEEVWIKAHVMALGGVEKIQTQTKGETNNAETNNHTRGHAAIETSESGLVPPEDYESS